MGCTCRQSTHSPSKQTARESDAQNVCGETLVRCYRAKRSAVTFKRNYYVLLYLCRFMRRTKSPTKQIGKANTHPPVCRQHERWGHRRLVCHQFPLSSALPLSSNTRNAILERAQQAHRANYPSALLSLSPNEIFSDRRTFRARALSPRPPPLHH